MELAFLEGLIEPDQFGRPRAVADHDLQDGEAPAGPHFLDRGHGPADQDGFPRPARRLADGPDVAAVFIIAGHIL